ncbi:hypothetical protein L1887_47435 [Cichorium endivia]|nr:hypothetical protein L1887_47435 [Cichorium endivia]
MPARRWWPRRQKIAKSSADKKVLVAAPQSGAWGDAAANLRVDAPPPARLSPNSPPASVPLPTSVSALHNHGRARPRTALLSRRQCRPAGAEIPPGQGALVGVVGRRRGCDPAVPKDRLRICRALGRGASAQV